MTHLSHVLGSQRLTLYDTRSAALAIAHPSNVIVMVIVGSHSTSNCRSCIVLGATCALIGQRQTTLPPSPTISAGMLIHPQLRDSAIQIGHDAT